MKSRDGNHIGMGRRIASFAGLPLLSSLAPFFLLPFIARIGGPGAWASIGVGQAIGAIAIIVVSLGWTLTGPAQVAAIPDYRERRRIYSLSLLNRGIVFLVCIPLLVPVSAALAPSDYLRETIWMAIASASAGLSPAWFCIAIGSAGKIARYDVLPRLIAMAASFPAMIATQDIIWFPISMLVGTVLGTAFFTKRHSRYEDFRGVSPRNLLASVWRMRTAFATTFAAGAYAATPILVVAATASVSSLAMFVSAEKLYRVGLLAVGALGNSLQGWVAEHGARTRERMKFSLLSHGILGVLGLLIIVIFGPPATRLIFGDSVAADLPTCFWFGLAFLFVSLNTATGAHILVPLGRIRAVLCSTVAGAGIGLPAMVILGQTMQGTGAAVGLAIGELVVCCVQGAAIIRLQKNP